MLTDDSVFLCQNIIALFAAMQKKTANSLSVANNYGSRLTASGKLDIKIPQKFCPLNNYLHFCGAGGFPFRNPPVPLFM